MRLKPFFSEISAKTKKVLIPYFNNTDANTNSKIALSRGVIIFATGLMIYAGCDFFGWSHVCLIEL